MCLNSSGLRRPLGVAIVVLTGLLTTDLAAAETARNLFCSGCVNSQDIKNGGINSKDIKDGQVKKKDLSANAVDSSKIADGAVKNADLANGAVNSDKIQPNAIDSGKIADGAVNSDKIQDNAISSRKVASESLKSLDLGDEAGVEFDGGSQIERVSDGNDKVIRSVTVTAPRDGFVIVNASGTLSLPPNGDVKCSLTTGTTIEVNDFQYASNGAGFHSQIFGMTEVFVVPVGTTTFRLVCNGDEDYTYISYTHVNALYVPTRY